ncbi:MAG: hypothetical protein P4L79_04080 [Legionella sp.]|uniref:surface-adhesin E family protein n=1 Tax=Legionella sp. TaxID=459 RepID=UPI0028422F57|nr:hypothetical protein [Legionella sp.]
MLYARLLVFLFLFPVVAQAADWRFYGSSKIKTDDESLFYDAGSVQHLSETTVRVWMTAFPKKQIDHVMKTANEKMINATAKKMASGYIPDYCLLQEVEKSVSSKKELDDMIIDVIGAEVAANSDNVKSSAQFFYEIDCSKKRIGELSITFFNPDGSVANSRNVNNDTPKFSYIPPNSNAERLSQMVCTKP